MSRPHSDAFDVCRVVLRLALVLACSLLPALAAIAATGDGAIVDGAGVSEPTAAVVVDGIELFWLRGAESYPAGDRARDVARRIVAFARDRSLDPETIRVEASELGPRLTYGDGSVTIVAAVGADARRESLSQDEIAFLYQRRIETAVKDYRAQRTSAHLIRGSLITAAATTLLLVLVLVGRWASSRIDRTINRQVEGTVDRLRIQTFRLLSAEQAWRLLGVMIRTARVIIAVALLYAYFNLTLSLFPWTRGFSAGMLELVLGPLVAIGQGILASIPDVVFLIVLTFVTRLVLRLIHLFFLEIDRGAVSFQGFDSDWAMPTYRLVRVLVIAFAVVVAYPYIPGSSTGAFKGVSVFVGVLFSLGSSSVIGNFIAGYTMTYRRAFRDGDRIRVGDVFGQVTQTRVLVTNVRTPKNEDVVIPNSVLLASNVVNYSTLAKKHGLILHTTVGIGYEVPWRQVEAMLLLAAERTEGLLEEPPPFVLETALADFAVTYELNVYCDAAGLMPRLYSALHRNILDVFNEYGVQIMTPSYENDTPEPKLVPREQWYAAPARRTDGDG